VPGTALSRMRTLPEVPAHRQQDHLGRETEAGELRWHSHRRPRTASALHRATLTATVSPFNATEPGPAVNPAQPPRVTTIVLTRPNASSPESVRVPGDRSLPFRRRLADVDRVAARRLPKERTAAVTELFNAHYGQLVRTARLLVDDMETAEDVVMDAFTSLYR
jgi:hypothetical protein